MVPLLFVVACAYLVPLLFCSSKASAKSKSSASTETPPGNKVKKTTSSGDKNDPKPSNIPEYKQQSVGTKSKADATTGSETPENKTKDGEPEGKKAPNNDENLKFGDRVKEEEPPTNFDSVDENDNPFRDNKLQEKLKNVKNKHSTAPTLRTKKSKSDLADNKTTKTAMDPPDKTQSVNYPADSKQDGASSKIKAKTKRSKASTESKQNQDSAKKNTSAKRSSKPDAKA